MTSKPTDEQKTLDALRDGIDEKFNGIAARASRKLDIVNSTLNEILHGKRKPTEDQRKKFKRAFGIPIDAWPKGRREWDIPKQ